MKTVRPNYAAGKFYPSEPEELIRMLDAAVASEQANINYSLSDFPILGGIVPHAGMIFCAAQSIHLFEILKQKLETNPTLYDTVIILHPSHYSYATIPTTDAYDTWASPLGESDIDKDLAYAAGLKESTNAESEEHSGEVILPYIHHFIQDDIPILPISIPLQNNRIASSLASALSRACTLQSKKALCIASSDFHHFASPLEGATLDSYALEALLSNDPERFEQRIREHNISICGFGAILGLYHFCRLQGKFELRILRKGSSGEVIPSEEVVDYVSLIALTKD